VTSDVVDRLAGGPDDEVTALEARKIAAGA
jgi:hypothetical protein